MLTVTIFRLIIQIAVRNFSAFIKDNSFNIGHSEENAGPVKKEWSASVFLAY